MSDTPNNSAKATEDTLDAKIRRMDIANLYEQLAILKVGSVNRQLNSHDHEELIKMAVEIYDTKMNIIRGVSASNL